MSQQRNVGLGGNSQFLPAVEKNKFWVRLKKVITHLFLRTDTIREHSVDVDIKAAQNPGPRSGAFRFQVGRVFPKHRWVRLSGLFLPWMVIAWRWVRANYQWVPHQWIAHHRHHHLRHKSVGVAVCSKRCFDEEAVKRSFSRRRYALPNYVSKIFVTYLGIVNHFNITAKKLWNENAANPCVEHTLQTLY